MIYQLPKGNAEVVVVFRLPAQIWADSIHLVGDFNGWSTVANPMRLGPQYWEANLTLPVGGRYYYAYLIDGADWCTDHAPWASAQHQGLPVAMIPIEIPQARRRVASHGAILSA